MSTRSTLLDRIIEPQAGGLLPEHARYILSLDFSPDEHARYCELSAKAQTGTLTEQEQADLDEFLTTNALLMILQSKARISLKQHTPAA